jgi:OPA family glycerol-3-phosphate transporter-like MFS transporter
MFAILTGCMHGVNLMLVCMVPPYFKSTGKVSTVSGVLNAATYVGSAASTYGIAVLSDALGWDATILIWLGIAACGAAICLLCRNAWNKYKTSLE